MSIEDIQRAAEILRAGGLVAFPTETVYGLGADATNADAVAKIFTAKGRPSTNPLIVHVPDIAAAKQVVSDWPAAAQRLAEAFWPGPLTLVLPKADTIPPIVTAGRATVGVRVPDHPLALALLRAFAGPVAAPSANPSNRVSPTTAEHVRRQLGSRVELILDGGPCTVGIESTVLSLAPLPEWAQTAARPVLLRPGGVARDRIESIVGPILMLSDLPKHSIAPAAPSPGMSAQHYAPAAEALAFEARQLPAVAQWLAEHPERFTLLLALHNAPHLHPVKSERHEILALPSDPDGYARALYAALHAADARQFQTVLVQLPPDTPPWHAVRDRLLRATRPIIPSPGDAGA